MISDSEILAFTFHYVSIKSKYLHGSQYVTKKFTFHYVSIKSFVCYAFPVVPFDLHSTMYLLNRIIHNLGWSWCDNLHSTMYLLNLCPRLFVYASNSFTFHYVSIKSIVRNKHGLVVCYLHSTMYLLNHKCKVIIGTIGANLHSTMYLLNPEWLQNNSYNGKFTFHYVSIKSSQYTMTTSTETHLHSTMYLLNLPR